MSVKKNFALQILYQILILGVPLIMAPLLTRTLGAESLGVYSYTNSMAYYFVCLAMLGIRYHGIRELAFVKNDKEKLRIKFWNLYLMHFIFSIFAIGCYLFFLLFVEKYKSIFWIQFIYVSSSIIDITWLFYGLENFKSVVIRNTFVKILEVLLVIIFIRTPDDIGLYTLIMCCSVLLGHTIVFVPIIKKIPYITPSIKEMKLHFKPIVFLSLSTFAYALYTMIDKTFLGMLSTVKNVGLYEYSEKLAKMPNTIITSLGIVMLPRMASLLANSEKEKMEKEIYYSIILTFFMSCGAMFGLAGISTMLIPIYYGNEFIECSKILVSLCPIIYIVCFGSVIINQYLLPRGLDKYYNLSLITSAIVNVVLNILLIPKLDIYGAVIGTILAETSGLLVQLYAARRELPIMKYFLESIPFIINGFLMFLAVYYIGNMLINSITSLILLIIIGMVIYVILSIIYIFICKKDIRKIIINKCNYYIKRIFR